MNNVKKLGKLSGSVSPVFNARDIAFVASYLNQCIDTINILIDRVDQLEREVAVLREEKK